MPTAAIVIVGDEILDGHTQDTNSHYLAQRLRARGVRLRRIVTIPDEPDEIDASLRALLADGLDHVLVCGGIGPTPDDRTYEAVAMALGLPLVVAAEDEAWLRRRVASSSYGEGLLDDPERAEALWRMIRRPEGSVVIPNPVGAALGSAVEQGRTTVYVLPGVPRELRAMFESFVEPRLGTTAPDAIAELELRGEEARLWPTLRDLEARFPEVRIGSYPQDDRGRILLRLQGRAAQVEAAMARLESAIPGSRRRNR